MTQSNMMWCLWLISHIPWSVHIKPSFYYSHAREWLSNPHAKVCTMNVSACWCSWLSKRTVPFARHPGGYHIISSELKSFQRHISGLKLRVFCWKGKMSYRNAKGKRACHQVGLFSTRKLSLDCKRPEVLWQDNFLSTESLPFSTGEFPFPSGPPPCPPCSWALKWAALAIGGLICDRRWDPKCC